MNPDKRKSDPTPDKFNLAVLQKINLKKKRKRIFLLTFSLILFLFGSVYFISKHLADLSYKNKTFQARVNLSKPKEVIHLTDKFFLPTTKSNSHYLIQEVSYQNSNDQI